MFCGIIEVMEVLVQPKEQKNKEDARFERCEMQIRKALCVGLTQRKTVKISELCKIANISRATFYAHHSSCGEALRQYETDLKQSFDARMNYTEAGKEVVFTILLSFIHDERGYFAATIPNSDYWLLNEIFGSLKSLLAETTTNDRNYDFYTQEQIGIIHCWVKYEDFSTWTIPCYARKMSLKQLA